MKYEKKMEGGGGDSGKRVEVTARKVHGEPKLALRVEE